ncbi:MAG TPA: T9SS type A sorting domain-containing protein [Bacteroidales bacterium]|nr:T9SS type A sorting domain-containing protein [Bacteroidales bacterium]
MRNVLLKFTISLALLVQGFVFPAFCQYPPPAGQAGTTAMYRDSSAFIGWAISCTVHRGYIQINDTTLTDQGSNRASYGAPEDGTGKPDYKVVSLGDGGSAVCTFSNPINNGPGYDFAVFENAFNDTFLELGFVEVSTDGLRYVRFPSVSLTQDTAQVPFVGGSVDATQINDLAGKYRAAFGTPFDLEEIKDSSGIDVNNINYVRIIDVVGCIQVPYATYDSQGRIVNDPWPTPFYSCGFDLDAVGVIHMSTGLGEHDGQPAVRAFPNPCRDYLTVSVSRPGARFTLYGITGNALIGQDLGSENNVIDISSLSQGLYIGMCSFSDGSIVNLKIVKQ